MSLIQLQFNDITNSKVTRQSDHRSGVANEGITEQKKVQKLKSLYKIHMFIVSQHCFSVSKHEESWKDKQIKMQNRRFWA